MQMGVEGETEITKSGHLDQWCYQQNGNQEEKPGLLALRVHVYLLEWNDSGEMDIMFGHYLLWVPEE
jgi:hypothetical protein